MAKVIFYQKFKLKISYNTFYTAKLKLNYYIFLTLKFLKLGIQYIINKMTSMIVS